MPCVACTYMPNASWRRRGQQGARGGESPTLGGGAAGGDARAERSGGLHATKLADLSERSGGRLGILLARARGGAPLRSLCTCSSFSGGQGRRCGQERGCCETQFCRSNKDTTSPVEALVISNCARHLCASMSLTKRFRQFGRAEHICDALEVVCHRREADFDPCTRQPAHQ